MTSLILEPFSQFSFFLLFPLKVELRIKILFNQLNLNYMGVTFQGLDGAEELDPFEGVVLIAVVEETEEVLEVDLAEVTIRETPIEIKEMRIVVLNQILGLGVVGGPWW